MSLKQALLVALFLMAFPISVVSQWWNENYQYAQRVNASAKDADMVIAGHPVKVIIDHNTLVGGGKSLVNGSDMRILYNLSGSWVELDRQCFDLNTASTTCWFPTQTNLTGNGYDSLYWLYYGYAGAGAPPQNLTAVYSSYLDRNKIIYAWYMQEGTGTAVADSKDALSGTLTNPKGNDWVANAKWGKWALRLNKTSTTSGNPYVAVGACSGMTLDSSKNLTLITWATQSSTIPTSGGNQWLFYANGASHYFSFGTQYSGGRQTFFGMNGNSGATGAYVFANPTLNTFYYYTDSFDNSGNRHYLMWNGVAQNSTVQASTTVTLNTACRLGGYTGDTVGTWNGTINGVVATNQFVSEADSASFYNAVEPLAYTYGSEESNAPTSCLTPSAGVDWTTYYTQNCTFANLNVNIGNWTANCDGNGFTSVGGNLTAQTLRNGTPGNNVCSLWILPNSKVYWGVN